MLGRQVGTSLLRVPRCARLPIRALPCLQQQQQYDLAIRTLAPSALRSYADVTTRRPGRPKKAVGEPSRPVKRAVKRAAKSPKEDAATKMVKANKETAAKRKKAAAKPKKKTLTEEDKAKKAEKTAKRKAREAKVVQSANTAELKKLALDPPHIRQTSAWLHFMSERQHLDDTKGMDAATRRENFRTRSIQIGQDYRNITPAEQEHYNHLAHTSKEKEQAAYKQYVESHSVEEIEAANKARVALRRKLKGKRGGGMWPKINDERAVKRPVNPFAQFIANRFASGDFKHMVASQATKLIAQEWKALSEEEKKKYQNLHKQDTERFKDEYTTVHGHAPLQAQPAQAAAAAA